MFRFAFVGSVLLFFVACSSDVSGGGDDQPVLDVIDSSDFSPIDVNVELDTDDVGDRCEDLTWCDDSTVFDGDVVLTDDGVADFEGFSDACDAGDDFSDEGTVLDGAVDVFYPDDMTVDTVVVDVLDDDFSGDVMADETGVQLDQGPTSGMLSVYPKTVDDTVYSYLISADEGAWNVLGGSTMSIGRHWDTAHVSYHSALRFDGVKIPANVTITSAILSFLPTNEVDSSNNLRINVYAEKSGDSSSFSLQEYEKGRPDQRLRTDAHIDHLLVRCNADCTDLTEYDCPQRQLDCWDRNTRWMLPKDLSGLIQEVVDLSDWQSGNAISLLMVNSATDEDGPKYLYSRSFVGADQSLGIETRPTLTITWTDS